MTLNEILKIMDENNPKLNQFIKKTEAICLSFLFVFNIVCFYKDLFQ